MFELEIILIVLTVIFAVWQWCRAEHYLCENRRLSNSLKDAGETIVTLADENYRIKCRRDLSAESDEILEAQTIE